MESKSAIAVLALMRSDKQILLCRPTIGSGLLLRKLCLSYALHTNCSPEAQTIHGFMRRGHTVFLLAFPRTALKRFKVWTPSFVLSLVPPFKCKPFPIFRRRLSKCRARRHRYTLRRWIHHRMLSQSMRGMVWHPVWAPPTTTNLHPLIQEWE